MMSASAPKIHYSSSLSSFRNWKRLRKKFQDFVAIFGHAVSPWRGRDVTGINKVFTKVLMRLYTCFKVVRIHTSCFNEVKLDENVYQRVPNKV